MQAKSLTNPGFPPLFDVRHYPRKPLGDIILEVNNYIQFLANAILFVMEHRNLTKSGEELGMAIISNMKLILDHLGATFEEDDSTHEVYVIYTDEVLNVVKEGCPEISSSLIEYKKIDNRGDINRKREILCSLSNHLEKVASILKKNGHTRDLYTDTSFLLNKSGIRHACSINDPIESKFINMCPDELEQWYDNTFEMIIACLAVVPYAELQNPIKELRKC